MPLNLDITHSLTTPVLALYDPFGVDVPLNFSITHTLLYQAAACLCPGVFHFQDTSVCSVGYQSALRSKSAATAARSMREGGVGWESPHGACERFRLFDNTKACLFCTRKFAQSRWCKSPVRKGLRLRRKAEGEMQVKGQM